MTNITAAAPALSSRILGGRLDWADAFASWSPHELSGIPKALQANLEVGFNLAKGWITPVLRMGDRTPSDVVSGPPWDMEARSVVNGVEHWCVRTSAGSSTGTTPTNRGNAPCTAHVSRPTTRCSKARRHATPLQPSRPTLCGGAWVCCNVGHG
jgi:hypothetical protein